MAREFYGSVDGKTDNIKEFYGVVDGKTKSCVKVYGAVGGQTKLIFEKGKTPQPTEGWGTVYYKTNASAEIQSVAIADEAQFNSMAGSSTSRSFTIGSGSEQVTLNTQAYPTIIGIEFGSKVKNIPNNFLYSCQYLNYPFVVPEGVTSIGNYVLGLCPAFNSPVSFPSTLTSLGNYFLVSDKNCRFNSTITFAEGEQGPTVIGEGFLYRQTYFNQSITLPNSLEEIKDGYLMDCTSFNSPVVVPNKVKIIGKYFLSGDYYFNRPVTLSDSITTIKGNFLDGCQAFNQPVRLPENLTSIGDYFLGSGMFNFNQPITFPAGLKSIGDYFLGATTYRQVLALNEGLESIGNYFLYQHYYPQVQLPSTLKKIGKYFLYSCNGVIANVVLPENIKSIGSGFMRDTYINEGCSLVANCPPEVVDGQDAVSTSSTNKDPYKYGFRISGTHVDEWIAAFPNSDTAPYRNLKKV